MSVRGTPGVRRDEAVVHPQKTAFELTETRSSQGALQVEGAVGLVPTVPRSRWPCAGNNLPNSSALTAYLIDQHLAVFLSDRINGLINIRTHLKLFTH